MREVIKSMVSFSWAMSLFSAKQMTDLLARPEQGMPKRDPAEAIGEVTNAMEEQLGNTLHETFKAGDKFQRGMLDMMFGMFGGAKMGPGGTEGMMPGMPTWEECGPCGQDARNRDEQGRPPEDQTGWGPIPPPGSA